MKLSTKGRYALEGMFYIALQPPGCVVNTREIAKETGITLSYLEQIFFLLKKSGLLVTERGAAGGFRLALPAEQVTAGMVVRAIEGDLAPVPCIQSLNACRSKIRGTCVSRSVWMFHGSTIAFKDMALSILPHLMTTAARKNHVKNEIVILTATSGDTGKAAMAGFADVPGTRIIVFYPKNGVSAIQEKQMVTQKGKNTSVVGITGNFDDAQSAVKRMFNDQELAAELDRNGFQFSSANSINIGRLVPQIVYYVYAYAKLVKAGEINAGEKINITVPTGNFGNILAAYYAKQMGLPIHKLICASNENKVLYDFFRTGTYDRKREFILTASPSMDILISSNLERLIYRLTGEDSQACAELMRSLSEGGEYTITEEMKKGLEDFYGNYCSEGETREAISATWYGSDYVIDPHTAVAAGVYQKYLRETEDATPVVIASTASPYKFAKSVITAISDRYEGLDDFALCDALSALSGVRLPAAVEEIRTAPVLHDTVVAPEDMPAAVRKILGI